MGIYTVGDRITDDREYLNRMRGKSMHNTVIKIAEVSYQTGLSRATIYREIKAGNFPEATAALTTASRLAPMRN